MPFVLALLSFLLSYYYLNLGINVIKKGKRSMIQVIFFISCICYAAWSFFYTFINYTNNYESAYSLIKFSVFCWAPLPSLSLLFVTFFTIKKQKVFKIVLSVIMTASTLYFIYASLSGSLMAVNIERSAYGWIEYTDADQQGSVLFAVYSAIALGLSLVGLVLWRIRAVSNKEKKQSILILFGLGMTFILSAIAEIFLPIAGINWIPSFGHFYGIFFAVSVEVSLLSYNLLQSRTNFVLSTVLPHIRDIVLVIDLKGNIEQSNLDTTLFAMEPESVSRIKALNALFVRSDELTEKFHNEYLDGKRAIEFKDEELQVFDGRRFPADIFLSIITDRFGDDIGFLLIIKDTSQMKDLKLMTEKLQDSNRKLIHIAETDSLTGIKNRKKMDDVLDLEMAVSAKYNTNLSMIMFDLDNFKEINDNYGHDTGDVVLSLVSKEVDSLIRSYDVLARWGGEEFLVLCRQTNLENAAALAERIRLAIVELSKKDVVDFVSASFGVAEYDSASGESKRSFLIRLDKALYQSKNKGKNCVSLSN